MSELTLESRPSREAVFKAVQRIVADQVKIDTAEVGEATNLRNDLAMDSLDEVEIVMVLEDEFEISVPDEASSQLRTVQQIVDALMAIIAERKDGV